MPQAATEPGWQKPAALLAALLVAAAAVAAVGVIEAEVPLLVLSTGLLLISLVLLTALPVFGQFRASYSHLNTLIVGLGSAVILAMFGAIYLTAFGSQLTERSQTIELLKSAWADADSTRIHAESLVLVVVKTKKPDISLSSEFQRINLPLPERLIKITSELLIVRNISQETLSAVSSNIQNSITLTQAIKSGGQRDDVLKQSIVFYIDCLAYFDVLLISEIKRINGDINDAQMHRFHQAMTADSTTIMNPTFTSTAFYNTPIIANRRLSAAEEAYKIITHSSLFN